MLRSHGCLPVTSLSPQGAERQVRVPGELQRFAELPMKVEYSLEEDKVRCTVTQWFELMELGGWGGGWGGGEGGKCRVRGACAAPTARGCCSERGWHLKGVWLRRR